jgi:hypothetical protein
MAGRLPSSADERLKALARTAPVFSRSEVLAKPYPIPDVPGVYGWFFGEVPDKRIDASRCIVRNGLTLLYVGIAPERRSSAARPSSGNLRKRIRYHFTGNASGSTLRLTLGCLLSQKIGIELRRRSNSNSSLSFGSGEGVLDEWMATNASVAWIATPAPWLLEDETIKILNLPLNISRNDSNAFHPLLKHARAAARTRARQLPPDARTRRRR